MTSLHNATISPLIVMIAFLLTGCLTGCTEENQAQVAHDDHVNHHHEQPETIEDARMVLFSHWIAVKKLPHGHDEEFISILRQIPLLAAQTDLPKSEWDQINQSTKTISEKFNSQSLTIADLQQYSDLLLSMHRKAVELNPATRNKAQQADQNQQESSDA